MGQFVTCLPQRRHRQAKGYDVGSPTSDLVAYDRRPEDLPEEVAPTVGAMVEITGKSIQTLHREISLLKLFDEIQTVFIHVT
ncbi:MAG: hypothetical protein NTX75_07650 [Proteobacteria bacterium]|nr:hypothetical protein [Pseudomonadota bacterium]